MPIVIIEDSRAKFKAGDKVRFNGRVPQYIASELRRRTRTITAMAYDSDAQCCYYQLGDRGKGNQGYWFRSYMLYPVNGNRHTIGRPRQKRKYHHKVNSKLLLVSPNQKLGGLAAIEGNIPFRQQKARLKLASKHKGKG